MSADRRRKHHAREDDLMKRALTKYNVRVDDDADKGVEQYENEGG